MVTVRLATKAFGIDAVSCGRGTRVVHPWVLQVNEAVPVAVWVVAAVKVIPELPPQSPESPVIAARFQEPAPAPVMSRKSTLEQETVAAVIVRAVPMVFVLTSTRLVTELPFMVNAPVVVMSPKRVRAFVLTAVPVNVRFANVRFVDTPKLATPPVKTSDIPFQLNVCHVINDAPAAVQVTVQVLAGTVRFVTVTFHGIAVVIVKDEEPRVSVLVFELFELKPPQVQVCPFRSRVPLLRVNAPVVV